MLQLVLYEFHGSPPGKTFENRCNLHQQRRRQSGGNEAGSPQQVFAGVVQPHFIASFSRFFKVLLILSAYA